MNEVLCGIAMVLMIISIALFFGQNAASTSQRGLNCNSKHRAMLTGLAVAGTIVAFGGFWVDWMLWTGLIMIEIGCIAYYVTNLSRNDSANR